MFIRYAKGMVYWGNLPTYGNNNLTQGDRPYVIVSNDVNNMHSKNIMVVPCTTNTTRDDIPTHVKVKLDGKDTMIQCEQILTINPGQLRSFYGLLDKSVMDNVDKALSIALGIEPIPETKVKTIIPDNVEKLNKPSKQIVRNQGVRISTKSDMTEFLNFYEQNGVEQTMEKYSVRNKSAIWQRIQYYKNKLGVSV